MNTVSELSRLFNGSRGNYAIWGNYLANFAPFLDLIRPKIHLIRPKMDLIRIMSVFFSIF